jgi:hypothetical protein
MSERPWAEQPSEESSPFGRGHVQRCSAHNRAGEQCSNPAIKGKATCRIHGGKSLSGSEHPNFKTGLYSKYMREDAAEKYQEILESQDLLDLSNEIALLKTMLTDELQEANDGGSPRTWKKLKTRWSKFMRAVEEGDTQAQTKMLFELDEYINDGARVAEAQREIKNLSAPISRLIKTHNDLLVSRDQMMPMDQVFVLLRMALQGFRESVYVTVEDKKDVQQIMFDAKRRFDKVVGIDKAKVIDHE